ncbi:MAG: DUF2238 domain-containing protein [Planctomycetota bacterium]|jgi:putative membrane protein
MRWPHHRYAAVLLALYGILFAVAAISPHDRADWALENALAAAFIAGLIATRNRFPLSRVSYTLIFLFMCMHTIGAHYTYSLVPYDRWVEAVTGRTWNDLVGWERNHYDRLVHLLYGLFMAYPVREVFVRVASARGFWGYFLPVQLTMSTSVAYEVLEWTAALVFGGDLGTLYVGTQGDPWDAQADMALATLGAAISMSVVAAVNVRLQRDFAREWAESLRVKRRRPLGEDKIREELAKRSSSE